MRQFRIITALLACVSATANAQDKSDLKENLSWQIALERVGFSPGILDGAIGRKTQMATREFQRVRGLPITGRLDPATRSVLRPQPHQAVTTYTVTPADLQQVGPVPSDWIARSKLAELKYESLEAALAEKFHCSKKVLNRLNPGLDPARIAPGDTIHVPNIPVDLDAPAAHYIEINLLEKIVRVLDENHRILALFHCSIAKSKDKLPSGETKVVVVSRNPDYTFDPKMWPEVKGVDRKLTIPPGPRNPVGLCWIGLGLPGVGIHGSPAPEMIGKTGSHGCFRLTNWDALRLAQMVRVGTPVRFVG